ncbi:MAG: hypothetical protein AB1445_09565 [Bacillota bacterium]
MIGATRVGIILGLLMPPLLVSIYTLNFGRWLGRRGYRRGALGVYLLAILALAVPAWLLLAD